MLRVECRCGRIMYEDIHQCPTCGMPRSFMQYTNKDFPPAHEDVRSPGEKRDPSRDGDGTPGEPT